MEKYNKKYNKGEIQRRERERKKRESLCTHKPIYISSGITYFWSAGNQILRNNFPKTSKATIAIGFDTITTGSCRYGVCV